MLEALDHTSLLVLDKAALSDLAARFPTVGDALTGRVEPSVAPAGGQRLERLSIRLPRSPATVGAGDGDQAAEARRISGSFRAPGL